MQEEKEVTITIYYGIVNKVDLGDTSVELTYRNFSGFNFKYSEMLPKCVFPKVGYPIKVAVNYRNKVVGVWFDNKCLFLRDFED